MRSCWRIHENKDGGRRHLGFFKLSEFGIFRRVESVVLELCTKFGSNICYSHWDRRTYAPDVHLMTSRELTSDFDFRSRGHLPMTVLHLITKSGAYIFIQSGVIDISRNSRWRPPPSLICWRETWDHPRRLIRGAYPMWKSCNGGLGYFQVIRIWNFCRSGLKVLFTPQNFSFRGVLPPKFKSTSFRPPCKLRLRAYGE